jgi:hypothetical protein
MCSAWNSPELKSPVHNLGVGSQRPARQGLFRRSRIGFALLVNVALALISTGSHAQRLPGVIPRPPTVLTLPMPALSTIEAVRREQRTLLFKEAVEALRKNPTLADLPACSGGSAPPCLPEPVAALTASPLLALPPDSGTPPVSGTPPGAETTSGAQTTSGAEALAESRPAPQQPSPTPARRQALLIGNNAYRKPIPALETPITDVRRIGTLLKERYGYQVEVLTDATRSELVSALARLVAASADTASTLILYAGHGYLVEDLRRGFWIPSDASARDPTGWLANEDILRFFKALSSRQSMLISDSCFSGSLIPADASKWLGRASDATADHKAAVIMSSGGDEPVSDEGFDGHSIFAWYLIQALARAGSSATTGTQSFEFVRSGVKKHYPQTPRYGAIPAAGHRAGTDFIFRQH